MVIITICNGVLWAQDIDQPEEFPVLQTEKIRNVSPVPASFISNALKSLNDIENLHIDVFPGGAILRGEILSPIDMRRIILLTGGVENVINLCFLHPEALDMAASYIMNTLKKSGVYGLKLTPFGTGLLISGKPFEEGDILKVKKICNSLFIPLFDGTRSGIADTRMVYFEVSFVEINKDVFKDIGFKWPSSTSFSHSNGMKIGRIEPDEPLEIVIDHHVHQGNARIISKPRLVCASGQKASFQAGGEIPIPRSDSEGGISVTWKPYGIMLEIAPLYSTEDQIQIQIRSEVSMVDHANAVNGVPGILTRKVETHLSLEQGQTIVLSGLVHIDDARITEKLPLMGDIPIVGELFKSHSFKKRETELVVFLTPLQISEYSRLEDVNRPK